MLSKYPIKHNSREELVYYLCDLHNIVNERLKKPRFDCKKAFDFWGGECGCGDKKDAHVQENTSPAKPTATTTNTTNNANSNTIIEKY